MGGLFECVGLRVMAEKVRLEPSPFLKMGFVSKITFVFFMVYII